MMVGNRRKAKSMLESAISSLLSAPTTIIRTPSVPQLAAFDRIWQRLRFLRVLAVLSIWTTGQPDNGSFRPIRWVIQMTMNRSRWSSARPRVFFL